MFVGAAHEDFAPSFRLALCAAVVRLGLVAIMAMTATLAVMHEECYVN